MISFIIPFSTIEKDKFLNLNEKEDLWDENDATSIVYSTIKTIKNINSLKCKKEIILACIVINLIIIFNINFHSISFYNIILYYITEYG